MKRIARFCFAAALSVVSVLLLPSVWVNAQAYVETFASTGTQGVTSHFNRPRAVFSDGDSLVFILDTENNLIRYVGYDNIYTLAGRLSEIGGGFVPIGAHQDGRIDEALFNRPTAGLVHQDGRIFILDSANHSLRVIDPESGTIGNFAGGEQGHQNGAITRARFNNPFAMAADARGNIFIADTDNHVIRRVNMNTGNVTTIAGTPGRPGMRDDRNDRALFDSPMGIAVSPDGRTIFVADTGNHLIRVIRNNHVSTLAGTFTEAAEAGWGRGDTVPIGGFADGESAMFDQPMGLQLFYGYIIVADSANHMIRKISAEGYVTTLAGTGYPGYADGEPLDAEFHFPSGLYIKGNILLIADTENNIIRSLPLGR